MAKSDVTVLVLTSSANDLSDTVKKIGESCKKYGAKFYPVLTQAAYIDDRTATHESITINNYDGKGKNVTLDPRDVVCFARGGVTNTQIGMAMLTIFENTGMFVINERRPMELCANKLYSAIQLDTYKIPTPRTAFVANLTSLDDALEKIGNKFPVIVKTLTGAEGVGVSIVESYESLKSILQTLWKYKAELLIQEYLQIKNDVRVLVLDGKVVAAAMRGKAPKDFRTNLAQGAVGGPYELSDQEREIAERAAQAFGCYYVGVDMVLSEGKPYVIELNASPGSGNVYRSYFPGSEGSSITGQRLIDNVVKHSIQRENWHFNHREAGLIEPINIIDVDKFSAKLDTGNESYNVLSAENIEEYNGTVEFTVNGKKYKKPLVSHVRIRTNNINVDRRPVVEFDVVFRNRTFRNVRFSLVPRRFNKYPVLIGNRFMKLAKVSVNINALQMLPEQSSSNHYVQKINSLGSFLQIDEMCDILREKIQHEKDDVQVEMMQQAIEYANTAKYNLKNQTSQIYDKDAIMHADKKFAQFLENVATNSNLLNLTEAEKQLTFGPMYRAAAKKRGEKAPPKTPKTKGKFTFEKYRSIVRKWVENNQDELDAKTKRLLGYDTPGSHLGPNGLPYQSGLEGGKIQGNFLGRMYHKYIVVRKKTPQELLKITFGMARNMSKGRRNMSGLSEKGRGPGKWKNPRFDNPYTKRRAATFERRAQGKLFGRQTKEFSGTQPFRTTKYGRVATPKMTRDRKTGEMRPSKLREKQIASIKRKIQKRRLREKLARKKP